MESKSKWKDYGKRFVVFFCGLSLIQIGVAMMLRLNIGSDPFTLFTQGISKQLHISAGSANRIITLILAAILLVVDRTYLQIGTVISIVCAGYIMDAMYRMYECIPLTGWSLPVKCIMFLIALIPISLGIPMIKLGRLGVAPNDCVYFVLEDRLKKPYSMVRMGSDAVYFVIGILLGGVMGIGTILTLVCVGPMAGFTFPRVERLVKKFYGQSLAEA